MKNLKYSFCRHLLKYLIWEFQIIWTKTVPTTWSWSLKSVRVHIWLWPDLVTWPFNLWGQNVQTRCIQDLCAGTPNLVAHHFFCLVIQDKQVRASIYPLPECMFKHSKLYLKVTPKVCYSLSWHGANSCARTRHTQTDTVVQTPVEWHCYTSQEYILTAKCSNANSLPENVYQPHNNQQINSARQ